MRTPSRSGTAWASRKHQRLLVGRVAADADADDRDVVTLLPRKPASRPPCVPELPEPTTTRSKREAVLEGLLLQLLGAGDVAEAAERVRAAAGNDVALAALGGERVGHLLHRRGHVGAGRHDRDRLDAQQAEQEMVAAALRVVAAGTRSSMTKRHFSPSFTAAARVMRQWFDCGAPQVISVSAPCASASATRNSSLRVLLPPGMRPSRSSRLTQTSGPRPPGHCAARAALKRGRDSSGVGPGCSGGGGSGRGPWRGAEVEKRRLSAGLSTG